MVGLEKILAKISLDEFFDEYYEQKILHLRHGSSFYDDVLTTKEIAAYLDRDDIFYPSVRLVRSGKELPQSNYIKNDVSIGHKKMNGLVDTERMMHEFNNNATIVIQAGQRYFKGVAKLANSLAETFSSPVQANLYITPQKSQGFNPHWDTHDVFVLQIMGTKTWQLYDFETYLPTKAQPFKNQPLKAKLTQTIQLQPGDLLYVPRGYVHDAVADDGVSAHITIGVLAYTWERFFKEALSDLHTISSMRNRVPMNAVDFKEQLNAKINELKDVLVSLEYDNVAKRLMRATEEKQAQPFSNYFGSVVSLDKMDNDTILGINKGLMTRVMKNDESIFLGFKGKTITLPLRIEETMDFIFGHPTFKLSEMPQQLNNESKILLIKKLIKEGYLYIVDDERK